MKAAACFLLVSLAVCMVQGGVVESWEQKARALETKFELWIKGKEQKMVDRVKSVEESVKNGAAKFIQREQESIQKVVASAVQDIKLLKTEAPLECFQNATKELMAAEEASVANLLSCQNMSQAYKDIGIITTKTGVIVLDVAKDVKVILQGIADCGVKAGFEEWKCAFEYAALEIRQVISQFPEAVNYIAEMKVLVGDLELQVNACLDSDSQKRIEAQVKTALDHFYSCARAQINVV